jgi:EmrB/QacA subfamily drug resistance transporter
MTVARTSLRALSPTRIGWQRRPTDSLLLVVCLAQFMVILDVSIVNVALPSIDDGLHFSSSGLQWVVNAYTLTFAGFLMLGGRCADLLGRRRVFLTGTVLFSASSLACALADSRGLLVGARAFQGFAGAMMSPATLSIVTSSLPEGAERNRGLGIWGAMGALGASSGALLGGVLTQVFGWPAIFAVNVPLGLVVVVCGLRFIPAAPPAATARNFDATGAVLITGSLASITYGIVQSDTLGWGSARVLGPIVAGVLLLGAFVLVEGRLAKSPLVPLGIFRLGQLRVANIVVVLLYAAFFPLWYFLTIYLQHVLGFSAIAAGLAFLPMTLSIMAASTLAPRAVAAFGARRVITAGMTCAAVGMALLTGLSPHGTYFATVFPGALLAAVGMGCSLVPATIVAMRGLPDRFSGLGSGLLNTSRLMGGALGLALLSTIASSETHAHASSSAALALTDGFNLAMAVGALFLVAGALVAGLALRPQAAASPSVAAEAPSEANGAAAPAVAIERVAVDEVADENRRRERVPA